MHIGFLSPLRCSVKPRVSVLPLEESPGHRPGRAKTVVSSKLTPASMIHKTCGDGGGELERGGERGGEEGEASREGMERLISIVRADTWL